MKPFLSVDSRAKFLKNPSDASEDDLQPECRFSVGSAIEVARAWEAERIRDDAAPGDPFVCSLSKGTWGKPLSVRNAQARFKASIKCLGAERVECLSIHSGRHSFCSHSLAGSRSLAEVRDAAGHSNISTTSIYLHVVRDDDEKVGNLFDFSR